METYDNGPMPTTNTGETSAGQEYRRVFEQHAEGMFDQARRTLDKDGVIDEPDLLRLVLARLLAQGEDASRHATKAADLANAVARLVTIRRQGLDRRQDDLPSDLRAVVADLEADRQAANATSAITSPIPEGVQP